MHSVGEAFGQLVIQFILLIRLEWLVKKDDFNSFGFTFQIFVVTSMSSFFIMAKAVFTYHNRYREALRPTFSLGSLFTVLMFTLMIVCKVVVYNCTFMVPRISQDCFPYHFSSKCSPPAYVLPFLTPISTLLQPKTRWSTCWYLFWCLSQSHQSIRKGCWKLQHIPISILCWVPIVHFQCRDPQEPLPLRFFRKLYQRFPQLVHLGHVSIVLISFFYL